MEGLRHGEGARRGRVASKGVVAWKRAAQTACSSDVQFCWQTIRSPRPSASLSRPFSLSSPPPVLQAATSRKIIYEICAAPKLSSSLAPITPRPLPLNPSTPTWGVWSRSSSGEHRYPRRAAVRGNEGNANEKPWIFHEGITALGAVYTLSFSLSHSTLFPSFTPTSSCRRTNSPLPTDFAPTVPYSYPGIIFSHQYLSLSLSLSLFLCYSLSLAVESVPFVVRGVGLSSLAG